MSYKQVHTDANLGNIYFLIGKELEELLSNGKRFTPDAKLFSKSSWLVIKYPQLDFARVN